jgi:hypothetical protein
MPVVLGSILKNTHEYLSLCSLVLCWKQEKYKTIIIVSNFLQYVLLIASKTHKETSFTGRHSTARG